MSVSTSPRAEEQVNRDVAEFYDRLGFPSRSSHGRYGALLPERPGERIGDFGCGQSLFHDRLRSHSPAPSFVDLSRSALRTIDYGHRVCADLRHLPFRDASYDRILCIGVLHHIPQRSDVLREMARVLAPGGRLLLGVYAPGTVNARLRKLYDGTALPLGKALVSGATSLSIQVRHAMRGKILGLDDIRRRTADFLEVPFVRFADPSEYEAEARAFGLRLVSVARISAMNILELRRT